MNRPAERVVENRAITSVFIGQRNSWETIVSARSMVDIDDRRSAVESFQTRHSSYLQSESRSLSDAPSRYCNFESLYATYLEKNYTLVLDNYVRLISRNKNQISLYYVTDMWLRELYSFTLYVSEEFVSEFTFLIIIFQI